VFSQNLEEWKMKNSGKTHKDLDIWKLGIDLVEQIYKETQAFPREEMYGLTSQMRRAAVSYPSNIAEGAARGSKKEFLQFLYILVWPLYRSLKLKSSLPTGSVT